MFNKSRKTSLAYEIICPDISCAVVLGSVKVQIDWKESQTNIKKLFNKFQQVINNFVGSVWSISANDAVPNSRASQNVTHVEDIRVPKDVMFFDLLNLKSILLAQIYFP